MRPPLRPEALENATVWVLSALHGIRQATRWIKGPVLNPDLTRRDEVATALAGASPTRG